MGIKIFAVGGILLGLEMVGLTGVPSLVTGIFLIIGGIGIIAGY